MTFNSLHQVYFSPTRTTQKIVTSIAEGIGPVSTTNWDLTLVDKTNRLETIAPQALTVFASPVYAGRIPANAAKRFSQFKGNNSPAVIVVTYGNREFEDALLELRHLVENSGFVVIAAGSFVCEHSYSTAEKPIASGRPDQLDLEKARQFGGAIREKATRLPAFSDLPSLPIPGNFPYKVYKREQDIAPVTDPDLCTECFECTAVCPVQAISLDDPRQTSQLLCIHCCACVKACPTEARQMNAPQIKKIANWLFTNYSARKEPEIFI